MVLHQSWLQRLKSKKDEPSSVTVTNQTASAALTPDDSTFSAVRDGEQPNEMASKSDEKTCASTTCLSEKGNNTVKTTDELQYLQPQALVVVMIALLLACLLMALDMSIVSTAIPRITDEFDTLADIGWYGSAYLLTCAALQPLTGKFYTYFLLKHAFFSFLGLFELGSVIAGAATSSKMLVIGRAVSGLGGAGLMNGCLTIVGVATSEKQRPMLMGIIMAFFGTGQLIGPLIGGALTEHASWRWCFYLNLPVGAATCLCLAFIHLPGQKRQPMQRNAHFIIRKFDLLGFCLFAPACIMVLLAMEWGGVHYTWSSATIIGLLCGSGGAFAVFGYWEYRASEDAMIPVDMISRRVIWTAVLTSAFQGGGIIMLGYYLPLFFQVVQHASPTASAVRILPTMIGQVVFAAISGAIVAKIGYLMPSALLGSAFATIGSGLLTTLSTTTPSAQWIGYQVLLGAGRGLAIQIPILVVQSSLTTALLPVGTAVVSWSQFFGGTIFLGLGQAALQNLLRTALHKYAPAVDPQSILNAGATGYRSVTPQVEWIHVEEAYAWAIARTFALGTGATGVAFLTSLGMGWTVSTKTKRKVEENGKG